MKYYLALILFDGAHRNVFGKGHPSELLTREQRGEHTIVILNFWPISKRQYDKLKAGS